MTEKHGKSGEKHASRAHEKDMSSNELLELKKEEGAMARHSSAGGSDSYFNDTTLLYGIIAVAVLLVLNQWQYLALAQAIQGGSAGGSVIAGASSGASLSLGSFALDSYSVLGPAHLALLGGEKAALPGYGSKVIKFPTISEHPIPASTGDIVQDLINALVPTGTPWYGAEAGVSFDDPLAAKDRWNRIEQEISLSAEQEQRFNKIVSLFTCDYCCGSPQNPTTINRCGCSHAGGWRGIARFFVKNYGDKYSDPQIMGEMTRWKTLWYPGPTVKRVLQEQAQAA